VCNSVFLLNINEAGGFFVSMLISEPTIEWWEIFARFLFLVR
jgi:hypothetical protein